MRALPALALLLATALLLSGCASSDSGGGGDGSSSGTGTDATTTSHTGTTTTTRSSSTTSTTTGPAGNHAPTGTVSASVPGGAVPLNVTFSLAGSDADKDPLSWTLDADGNGAADAQQASPATLPATATFTYTKPGTFNVTYTLTDGKATTTLHTEVKVTGTAQRATKQFTGHVVAPDPSVVSEGECVFAISNGALGTPGGVGGDAFSLDGDFTGWAFSFDVDGMVARFADPKGNYVDDGAAASGTVGPGATVAFACSDMAANTDYTLTLTSP